MRFFTRGVRDLSTLPPIVPDANAWGLSLLEGDELLVIRVNRSASTWAGHPGLPVRLGFPIPLHQPFPGGLPDPEEHKLLSPIEDTICAAVQRATVGVHALSITNGVMKEFVFYVPNGVDIATLHGSCCAAVATHEVQCLAELDAAWSTYDTFRRLAAQGRKVA